MVTQQHSFVAKRVFKGTVIALLFLVVLSIGAMAAFTKFRMYPVEAFCRDVADTDSPAQIIAHARSKGLYPNEWQNPESVWIFNTDGGPMFRFACTVEFQNGKVFRKSVIDAD